MAQSYTSLLYHVTFSTKDRRPSLTPALRTRLHPYLGGAVRALGGAALAVNGPDDHVHILMRLRPDKALSDVMRSIKANSSSWLRETFDACRAFYWQAGYGAFTVSTSQAEGVRAYIAGQTEHHRKVTFQEEFLALLKGHGIEHDARYVF